MPRVSVVIPAFDAEPFIAEALQSVDAQTFRDFEVVVADDGSTDRTAEIAASFPGVVVVATSGRLGPAGARNRALEAASGELMALLDADDLWEPELLAEQVALLDAAESRAPGVGVVACDARLLEPGGILAHTYADELGRPVDVTVTSLLSHNPIPACGVLVPMPLVREVGGFDPGTWGSEDHDLWLRIVERGHRVVCNPKPLAIYRRGAASVSADVIGMARTNQVTLQRALERGRLDQRQERIARRELRLHRTVERLAVVRRQGSAARMLREVPALARVAVENPQRWRRWAGRLRRGAGSGDGP